MFYIIFDFCMAAIMLLFGIWFYKSGGKAADFNYVFDEKEGNYVYQEPERQLPPPKTKGDKPKEPER